MTRVRHERKAFLDPKGKQENLMITIMELNEKAELIDFCVIQMHCPGNKKYIVMKYDSSHGECHAHRYYRNLKPPQEKVKYHEISKHSFHMCVKDIRAHWRTYKDAYVTKWFDA